MDPIEASTIVYNRILKFETPDVTKQIFGYLLIHLCKQEFIRLSFCPENLILNLIQSVKMELHLVPYQQVISPPISPSMNPNPISVPSPFWIPQIIPDNRRLLVDTKLNGEDFGIREHTNSAVPPFPCGYYHAETLFPRGPRSPSEFPIKTCHYFKRGFCKHGTKCRFFHDKPLYVSNGFSRMDESGFEEQSLSPGSLEKLEFEITELLKTKRGTPVSIASLPSLYLDKYGHNLQADGYLTESQRHGKVGYSLTKLLARLRSIRLIDRPHGQHDVVLAEDAQHFFESRSDRHDPGPILLGSRQIYLTFPAESTFSEEDAADYFSTYGVVQDVRIPCQQKRMFGFVTFASADTVKIILSKGNPHYVCGARVLVKPYKEKSKLIDRKYPDKHDHSMLYGSHYAELFELQSRWESRFMREPYMAEQEENVEAQIMQLSKMQLASSQSLANNSCLGYTLNQLGVQEDNSDFPSAERYKYLLDVLDTDESEGDNLAKQTEANNNADPKSYEVNLPE